MPIIFEKDVHKYYDEKELKLVKHGSGLFPAGHYPRKERSGDGFLDIIAQGAKIFKIIKENKDNIKGVAEAVGSVVTAGKRIKDAVSNNNNPQTKPAPLAPSITALSPLAPLAPAADTIDPDVYRKLRESVKEGTGLLKLKKGSGFKYD